MIAETRIIETIPPPAISFASSAFSGLNPKSIMRTNSALPIRCRKRAHNKPAMLLVPNMSFTFILSAEKTRMMAAGITVKNESFINFYHNSGILMFLNIFVPVNSQMRFAPEDIGEHRSPKKIPDRIAPPE